MIYYILRRLISLVVVLVGMSLIVFILIFVLPGDPITAIMGQRQDPETAARIKAEYGMDRSLIVQYTKFLSRAVRGDLGRSYRQRLPVIKIIQDRFKATLRLTLAAMFIAIVFGMTAGVIAAIKQYSWFDDLVMFASQIGFSTPVFYLGLILILIFGLKLRWFPIGGYGRGGLRNLVLPAITLGTIQTAYIAQITRSSLLEVIRQDFVRTARAKGLGEFTLIRKYILRNALIPIVTIIGSIFAGLLCGAVATEYIFAWPGLGRAIVEAIRVRDLPVVQGGVFFMALVYVLVNLVVDILYAYLDPRIRYR